MSIEKMEKKNRMVGYRKRKRKENCLLLFIYEYGSVKTSLRSEAKKRI